MNVSDDPNGPLCLAERHTGTGTWVCLRPQHRGHSRSAPKQDTLRRRRGQSVRSDQHYFVKRGSGVGQTGPFLAARTRAAL